MGCWGMGITQSDEFCEIYDRFIEEYDEGKPLIDIKKDILDEYLGQFDADDGVLHDVYFAIGKAEWMCGGISDEVLEKITQIVNSGANIEFYRELEATEKDLKQRKKNLDSFLEKLITPRGTTRKRKTPVEKCVSPTPQPNLPEFTKGDIFAYKIGDKYRVFCLINRAKFATTYASYCYVWARFFDEIPTKECLADDYVLPLGYFTVETFPPMEKLILVGNYPEMENLGSVIYPHIINEAWKPATWAIAKEENLSESLPIALCMKLSDALGRLDELRTTAQPKTEPNTEKGEKEMFGFKKKAEKKNTPDLDKILDTIRKNEISVTTCKAKKGGSVYRSKFGGKPAVPAGFEWPRFDAENYDGETANRPLSFLCQINLEEISAYDKENLLPKTGLLLFFYEQESMRWGFDPEDAGCSRVFYFEDVSQLAEADLPDDMKDEYKVKEYDLSFSAKDSYPSFEELDCHSDVDCDWDDYDEAVEKKGYELESEHHKLLGYADLVQGEMLTECERITRGLYCGDHKSYVDTPEDVKEDISGATTDWVLLFQMASIQEDDYELMFGDLGNLYFYIRKQDLKERNFDKVWLVLQCG